MSIGHYLLRSVNEETEAATEETEAATAAAGGRSSDFHQHMVSILHNAKIKELSIDNCTFYDPFNSCLHIIQGNFHTTLISLTLASIKRAAAALYQAILTMNLPCLEHLTIILASCPTLSLESYTNWMEVLSVSPLAMQCNKTLKQFNVDHEMENSQGRGIVNKLLVRLVQDNGFPQLTVFQPDRFGFQPEDWSAIAPYCPKIALSKCMVRNSSSILRGFRIDQSRNLNIVTWCYQHI